MNAITSIIDHGSAGSLIKVECRMSNSLPAIVIVGFTHRSVSEARERIRGALAASKIKLPAKRIIVNLAPADIPKHGTAFDLPILIAILAAAGKAPYLPSPSTIVLGEVGLDGSIRSVRGIIGKILAGKAKGITDFWVPNSNIAQATLVPGVNIYGFSSVGELHGVLCGNVAAVRAETQHELAVAGCNGSGDGERQRPVVDEVVGQQRAKRALVIAAAGHHNLLISGQPGTGKSLLAQQLLPLLPAMTMKELVDVTHLHSLTSKDFDKIVNCRPIRAPHHTTSPSVMFGSSASAPRPGEISLSHGGVLFLDELPEFNRAVIEGLRQPLEEQAISLASSAGTVKFAAHFLLVAALNPCPCGNYGSTKICNCSSIQLRNYQQRLSSPLLDRIDLFCETDPVEHKELLVDQVQSPLIGSVEAIKSARSIQHARQGKLNSQLASSELKIYLNMTPSAKNIIDIAASKMRLSARSYIRTLRVSRTIADLVQSSSVDESHIAEALQYRRKQAENTFQLTSVP